MTSILETQNPNKMRTCHCHLNPPGIGHQLITRDGTAFHPRNHGAKSNEMFIKSAPVCHSNSMADIWAWCIAFTQPAMIQSHHPTCHPHPTTSVRDPLKQRSGKELSSHFCRHTDCLQMRAHSNDNDQNLDNEVKLEDFVGGTIHKIQFQRSSCEDRKSKLPEVQMQFSQHRILGTLKRLHEENIKPSFSANP